MTSENPTQVEYFDCFLAAEGSVPLVESLWLGGSYEGPQVVHLRRIAEAAALEYDRGAARGAPVDHLGSILLLWASLAGEQPDHARAVAEHLPWSRAPLQRLSERDTFYGQVAAAALDLVDEILVTSGVT